MQAANFDFKEIRFSRFVLLATLGLVICAGVLATSVIRARSMSRDSTRIVRVQSCPSPCVWRVSVRILPNPEPSDCAAELVTYTCNAGTPCGPCYAPCYNTVSTLLDEPTPPNPTAYCVEQDFASNCGDLGLVHGGWQCTLVSGVCHCDNTVPTAFTAPCSVPPASGSGNWNVTCPP